MSDFGEDIPIISTFYDRQNSTDKLSPEVKLTEFLTESALINADALNQGYSEQLGEICLVIKFTGELNELSRKYGVKAFDLGFGFAVVNAKKPSIKKLQEDENVIYIDNTKRLYEEGVYG